jgi:hypothetical protein
MSTITKWRWVDWFTATRLNLTLFRHRLQNEPRAFVVGIAWVVECVEKRQRLDESKFKVNLEGMNVAGTNKVRRVVNSKSLATHLSLLAPSLYAPEVCRRHPDGPRHVERRRRHVDRRRYLYVPPPLLCSHAL